MNTKWWATISYSLKLFQIQYNVYFINAVAIMLIQLMTNIELLNIIGTVCTVFVIIKLIRVLLML